MKANMKKFIQSFTALGRKGIFLIVLLLGSAIGVYFGLGPIREVSAQLADYFNRDPDMGPFDIGMSKEEFMIKRAEAIGQKRGLAKGQVPDPRIRQDAIRQMEEQERAESPLAPLAAWTAIGPNPIPNGQTNVTTMPVSGRVTAIAVDPTNANLVYVGTAQGGLYKSADGGTT